MWEFFLLVFLIAVGFGIAILMVRKTKKANLTIIQQQADSIDLEELATKVARAVAKEVAEEVIRNLPKGFISGKAAEESSIQMDESLIPIAIETAITEANLESMTRKERAIDKDLEKSKSKLAGILKKRKDKDGSEGK